MTSVNRSSQPQSAKPSKGQIIVGIICALFLLGMLADALGINTTSKAYCDSTRRDIAAGHASGAAVERYSRDC
jgi:hypothetical protein